MEITYKTSGRQRLLNALSGVPMPGPAVGPLAVHYCAARAGVSLRDYTLNSDVLADCVARYYERFRPDAVWVSADTWVNAQAAGAAVAFTADDQPLGGTGEPLVKGTDDVGRLPPPDPHCQGRWPLMLRAVAQVRSRLGPEVFVVACLDQYPFSLACALMGLENLLARMQTDPPMVEALLARCADYSIAYGRALAGMGADMLSGGDSPAGLLGPKLYRRLAWPWEQTVITALKSRTSLPVSLHICGNATALLPVMAASGADVLELDQCVDLAAAANVVGPRMTLWGNIDPVRVLAQGTPWQVRQAARSLIRAMAAAGHRRFVLSSGCTLAVETPTANLQALFDAARE